jgi:hypothetical protein
MANYAVGCDGPVEVRSLGILIAGRHVPAASRKIADRGLEKAVAELDEVSEGMGS